jgi:septal ring factor EnvC (AmiA/AmiB activator)
LAPVRAALVLAVLLAGIASARAETPPTGPAAELETVREAAIAGAKAVQEQERKVAALAHQIELLRREADGRQRDLDESRPEQAALLGAIEHLARNPPERVAPGSLSPLDQARGHMLIAAMLPELRAEAQALAEEVERVAALRIEIGAKETELEREREALRNSREGLAELAARRLALSRKLALENPESERRIAKLGREAVDLGELLKRADAETERRDKDASRPRSLRVFDAGQAILAMPVAGTVLTGFGAEERSGKPSPGLGIGAMPGAAVVAPFDAQVIYAGKFRDLGPTLILRHGGGYHSVLAGLGRLDVADGQWVLAGEPVGMLPDAAGDGSGAKLYMELRRDGRPVDPQPWLANAEERTGRSVQSGEQRVRE